MDCFCQGWACEVLFGSFTAGYWKPFSHAGVHKLMDPSAAAALLGIFLEAGLSMLTLLIWIVHPIQSNTFSGP
jgi:hypothetical protein